MQNKHGLHFKDIIKQIIHQIFNRRADDVAESKRSVAVSRKFPLFSKTACDLLPCDKHLFSGATNRKYLRQSLNDFLFICESSEAYIHVRRVAVTDFAISKKKPFENTSKIQL